MHDMFTNPCIFFTRVLGKEVDSIDIVLVNAIVELACTFPAEYSTGALSVSHRNS